MNNNAEKQYELNKELAQMLKGGVIMDVTAPEQATGSGFYSGYGKMPYRSFRRSTDS